MGVILFNYSVYITYFKTKRRGKKLQKNLKIQIPNFTSIYAVAMRYTYRQKPKEKAVYMHHYEINEKVKYIAGGGVEILGNC